MTHEFAALRCRYPRAAQVYIQVYAGLMYFFVGQLTALVTFNVLRLLQREQAHEDALLATKSDDAHNGRSAARRAVHSPVFSGGNFNGSDGSDGGGRSQVGCNAEGGGDLTPLLLGGGPLALAATAGAGGGDLRDGGGIVGGAAPSRRGLARDSNRRQRRRDLRRAAAVVPAAGVCLGAFAWLWCVGPFVRFDTSGLLGPYVVANGPHLELGLHR